MKICIWYKTTDQPWGGSNSFLSSLIKRLQLDGYEVIDTPNIDCDIVLLNSFTTGLEFKLKPGMVSEVQKMGRTSWMGKVLPTIVWKMFNRKQTGIPIVHRCDGVTGLYGRKDNADDIQFSINQLTDFTVFQSEFCKKSFFNMGIRPRYSTIICNGVDSSLFFPVTKKKGAPKRLRCIAVSWSSNPKKGFAFLSSLSKEKDVELTFIGNWCKDYPAENIRIIGPLRRKEIADILRQQDVIVHAAENDPCPNALIEGLASGLPSLYHNSGGTPELSTGYGVPIGDDVKACLNLLTNNYSNYREKLLEDRDKFTIDTAAKKYMKVFKKLVLSAK